MKNILLTLFTVILLQPVLNAQILSDSVNRVKLKSFSARMITDDLKLNWEVVCNMEYAVFEIQRSDDGNNFTVLHKITADKNRCLQPFDFVDKTAYGKVFYRIVVGDIDGRKSLEKTIGAYGKPIPDNIFKAISPATGNKLAVSVLSRESEPASFLISNMNGSSNTPVQVQLNKGMNQLNLPVENLPAGVYTITLITSGFRQAVRFIKQ
jgi:hypothetical protein